jgi:UDP-glucose 4-epimerase
MPTYIVTGGAGFIGSHLVDALLREDENKVIVIDDLSTGHLEYLDYWPWWTKKKGKDFGRFKFIQVDISNWSELVKALPHFKGVSGVFHLAAQARLQPSIEDPFITHNSNVNGTYNILECMRLAGVKRIVYSSSSSCYGNNRCVEDGPVDCLNPYSLSKHVGERYCEIWGKSYGIKSLSLRYFNVYGSRSPIEGEYATVVGKFFRQALRENSSLTIVGDGTQVRDFTAVTDAVRANILAMQELSKRFTKNSGKVLNVGTGVGYTIKDVAALVKDALKGKMKVNVTHIDPRPGEAQHVIANVEQIKKVLDWCPDTELRTGIEALRNYYYNNLENFKDGYLII